MVEFANVKLWGKLVGVVLWNPGTQNASFEYAPTFIKTGLEVSPLRMPLQEQYIFSFPELNPQTFKGLPGMLADSLPDNFGNALINRWLAEQGRNPDSYNPIERLLYQGKRSMGALEFEPAEKVISNVSTKIELEGLVEAARIAISNKEKLDIRLEGNESELLQIMKVGTSAGGARAKAVIAYNEQTNEVRSGQLNAPEGFTHWLIKLDGVTNNKLGDPSHYGRIEYAYYKMAIGCGIEMTDCRLMEENGRAHFMTRRFDRIGGKEKLHMQTLCGLTHFDFNTPGVYSYEQLFQTMRTLRLPYSAAEQVYRRMIFNIVARNQDDHTKNFSFLMNQQGQWSLSPAYDMAYSYNPTGEFTSRHQMSVNGKSDNFTKTDLIEVARSMNIKKAEEIIEEVISSVSQWSKIASEIGIPENQVKAIGATLRLKWE
ncbi:serine/threonine-protein kinase HipA [Dysgonomonas sp. PFB1-18]|uniref:type II toxin-antitoxin system HipA family toxin n=1 Tax=unclassified Dysgonomonas TaxID=2630389 RepID=UPI0013D08E5D|nr:MULTISPECIES: type II toxin-antitoxin system HipA family toxin [unclassified Dysgonomonas]MDH6310079.1 serine/threonine-protein kinase HipA [Dysgonomonas sp. PF1-14]MDH6339988.1 serine/threonine-protein kinase HipA [Dysgonomonas sp. PF1-16]MDH6381636.1 serine/threonine-protein kinase HipA [Dysgonomonas sp. PFB1-18]MDH6398726.1 serine/threonine-protein kinase HipA [Dysgonomonas sp. PF1-23]NDV93572.1 type II toxin-antitoxin system HipA family toxin [Dysgonomonas sp. 521]